MKNMMSKRHKDIPTHTGVYYFEPLHMPDRNRITHQLRAGQEVLIATLGGGEVIPLVWLNIEMAEVEEEVFVGNSIPEVYPTIISRGAVIDYFNMNIGWPLAQRGSGTLVDISEADDPPRYVWLYEEDRNLNRITAFFGPRTAGNAMRYRPPNGNTNYRPHVGMDLAHPDGAAIIHGNPVISVSNGRVIRVDEANTTQGITVVIQSDLKDPYTQVHLLFYYQHLDSRVVDLHNVVVQGQKIGYVGNTGATTGPGHLHFEVSNHPATFTPQGGNNWYRVVRRINPRFFFDQNAFITDSELGLNIWYERRTSGGPYAYED